MSLLIAITLLLVLSVSSSCLGSNNVELSDFVRRIYQESDSVTVLFIGIDEEFLREFVTSSKFNIPVLIFQRFPFHFAPTEDFLLNTILVVQAQREHRKEQEDFLDRLISKLRFRKFVIISAFDQSSLVQSFMFFHEYAFTRIYGMENKTSYAFFPFAENKVQELTPHKAPLVDAYKDLNGFTFRTSTQDDVPRVFRYPGNQGHLEFGGCYGEIFMHFLRKHNANFEEVIINDCDGVCYAKLFNSTADNQIDTSMNIMMPMDGFDHSYPVKLQGTTVMVAFNGNLDPNQYFLRPFSKNVWLSIGLISLYIILMDLVKNLTFNLTAGDVWQSFSQLLLMLLNSSSGQRIKKDYRFYVQVLVMSFILGNIYNNHFTSFLTVFIKMKQFETMQDLIDNNIPIMMADYELKLAKEMNLLPVGSEKLFHSTDYLVYAKERDSMNNTKFAYVIGVDRAEFLIGLQKQFAKPLFHTIRDGLSKTYSVYILREHCPFREILDTFIIQVLETGLIIKWDRDAITQSLAAGFKINRDTKVQQLHAPLGLKHLVFAWNILGIGLSFAFIMFVGELLLKNYCVWLKK